MRSSLALLFFFALLLSSLSFHASPALARKQPSAVAINEGGVKALDGVHEADTMKPIPKREIKPTRKGLKKRSSQRGAESMMGVYQADYAAARTHPPTEPP